MSPPGDGRARYAAARARALARASEQTAPDPGPASLALLRASCACGHANCLHEANRAGKATRCTIITAAGPCGCRKYKLTGDSIE